MNNTGTMYTLIPWPANCTTKDDWTLHQLAPYIGRMKTSMAGYFVEKFTKPGDRVVDPFCGSGVIPVEAYWRGRHVVANDWNAYGALLTRAKLSPPSSENEALEQAQQLWEQCQGHILRQDLSHVPSWIQEFFHPNTLREALAFRDACVQEKNDFLLACLLGILHHQRPGFLSFPSSHLVPYLRDKKFPKIEYPELYEYRPLWPRLTAKIHRTYRRIPSLPLKTSYQVVQGDSRNLNLDGEISAVITSPPYMNALDYIRDNRLRLWFIERCLPKHHDIPARGRESCFKELMSSTLNCLTSKIKTNGHIILVLGDLSRGRRPTHPAEIVQELFKNDPALSPFSLLEEIHDQIPDLRRSRRDLKGTKEETILIYKNNRQGVNHE